ncbi:hypothetical protein Tco_1030052 [Tanacetum coccineum]|uniref:Uncharacterized protein n=1 Tax=Tanacetum coccineum TaxID=301880 RepID=A0ABQ5G5Q2_9ASTR
MEQRNNESTKEDLVLRKKSRENIELQGLLSKKVLQKERTSNWVSLMASPEEKGYCWDIPTSSKGESKKEKVLIGCLIFDLSNSFDELQTLGKKTMLIPGDKVSTLDEVKDIDDQQFNVHNISAYAIQRNVSATKRSTLSSEEQAYMIESYEFDAVKISLAKAHNDEQRD